MQTATNPETGERFVLVNGEWQPMQTATNPETGQQFALVDNEWQEMPSSAPPEPYQGTYGPLMDGLIEGVATVGSSVAGGIAGTLGGLWDAVTGEDYETARETQDRISSNLTYSPVSDGGRRAAEIISDAVDNPLFNYLGETGETWGQNTNDYLEETPFAFAAPAAGILAATGPDIAAGAVTGGAGAAAVRGGKALNATRKNSRVAPGVLDDGRSVGAAQVEQARQKCRSCSGA